jgi:hypothetical protein
MAWQQHKAGASIAAGWEGPLVAAAAQTSAFSPAASAARAAPQHSHAQLQVLCVAAAAQEVLAAGGGSSEIWLDQPTLTTLQQGQVPAGISSKAFNP